ncbi:hypothetical protein TA5113_00945 [Cognatishimia activa]|nr:hypothetical protein TA5113_00945 [Cognatishimia activa]
MYYISRIVEMKDASMKLSAFLKALGPSPVDLPVIYFTDEAAIGAGYHLTELKSAPTTSIDCGGNINHFHEVTLQLLDGSVGKHMTAGKLTKILLHSLKTLPDLDWADVKVEFAPNNEGLQLFLLGEPIVTDFEVRVPLIADGAVCKPAALGGDCVPSLTGSCC